MHRYKLFTATPLHQSGSSANAQRLLSPSRAGLVMEAQGCAKLENNWQREEDPREAADVREKKDS